MGLIPYFDHGEIKAKKTQQKVEHPKWKTLPFPPTTASKSKYPTPSNHLFAFQFHRSLLAAPPVLCVTDKRGTGVRSDANKRRNRRRRAATQLKKVERSIMFSEDKTVQGTILRGLCKMGTTLGYQNFRKLRFGGRMERNFRKHVSQVGQLLSKHLDFRGTKF